MPHLIEPAKSGRASCRTCRQPIAKGELRFGEEVPNQFDGGELTYQWHHLMCAAKKRPDALQGALAGTTETIPDRPAIEAAIAEALSKQKPKLPYAERASTGRSKCLSCEEPIAKGDLRIAVEREVDTGTFSTKSAGYLHLGCAAMYVGDPDLLPEVKANSRGLGAEDWPPIEEALAAGG